MALFDTIRAGASGAGGDYEVERSLRFNSADSAHLSRTISSDGNRRLWTWSGWLKMGKQPSGQRFIFSQRTSSSNQCNIQYAENGRFRFESGGGKGNAFTQGQFRDPTAWYHLIVTLDSDNGTAADRIIFYVNGERQALDISPTISTGDHGINNNNAQVLGRQASANDLEYDGYMAEIHFIDGARKAPSDFAETDAVTGEYKPIKYTGTYGTQGWYYNFSDNSNTTSSTLGKDYSGNNNNTTPGNISVAAWPANDSVTDTPTNNFCTLNPIDANSNVSTTNSNLETNSSTGGNHFPIFSSMSMKGGKYYMEYKCKNGDNGWNVQIMNIEHDAGSLNTDSTVGNNTSAVNKAGYGLLVGSGRIRHNTFLSSPGAYGSALAVNGAETGMCAVDLDNGKIWWGKEGTFFDSGDPANGTNAAFTGIDTDITWNFCFHVLNNNNAELNWGQHGFTHTPPDGFQSLCTANLPDPEIKLPAKHLDTILYTGTGSSQDITGLDFSPDLVWIKKRNGSDNHNLANTVRGAGKSLRTSTTGNETSSSGAINAFLSNGFRVVDAGETNENGNTYAAWNWKAGDSTVTNTSGTRTTQVRANQTCGFSIMTFNYGSGTQTLGHGLGKPPKWILGKTLDNTTAWVVYHVGIGANKWFNINTSPANSGSAVWNNQEPTSTLINLGTGMGNQGDAIFFAWSEIDGFSKFGKYFGNGSTNGPYVHLGFRPAWVAYKNVSQNGGQWFIRDNKRETFNPNNTSSAMESAGSEVSNNSAIDIDFLANGIKWRQTNEGSNNNGIQYVFMAFASHPTKYARAV